MDIVCNSPTCNPDCGYYKGYSTVQGEKKEGEFNFINPIKPNESHDLLAFKRLYDRLIHQVWLKGKYLDNFQYEVKWGTPQDLSGDHKHVKSVHDLRKALEINGFPTHKDNSTKYKSWTKVAEMDVYDDGRDYEFKMLNKEPLIVKGSI